MAILDVPTLTDCGCKAKVYQDGSGVDIEYCNKHRAAPDLLEALDESTTALEFALAGESVPAELVNRIQRNLDLIHEVKGK